MLGRDSYTAAGIDSKRILNLTSQVRQLGSTAVAGLELSSTPGSSIGQFSFHFQSKVRKKSYGSPPVGQMPFRLCTLGFRHRKGFRVNALAHDFFVDHDLGAFRLVG